MAPVPTGGVGVGRAVGVGVGEAVGLDVGVAVGVGDGVTGAGVGPRVGVGLGVADATLTMTDAITRDRWLGEPFMATAPIVWEPIEAIVGTERVTLNDPLWFARAVGIDAGEPSHVSWTRALRGNACPLTVSCDPRMARPWTASDGVLACAIHATTNKAGTRRSIGMEARRSRSLFGRGSRGCVGTGRIHR